MEAKDKVRVRVRVRVRVQVRVWVRARFAVWPERLDGPGLVNIRFYAAMLLYTLSVLVSVSASVSVSVSASVSVSVSVSYALRLTRPRCSEPCRTRAPRIRLRCCRTYSHNVNAQSVVQPVSRSLTQSITTHSLT